MLKLFQKLRRARIVRRTRAELAELDPKILRDLGVTRTEIDAIARARADKLAPLTRVQLALKAGSGTPRAC
jgi:uncharacterized protein YjiS (DUF1127 family)